MFNLQLRLETDTLLRLGKDEGEKKANMLVSDGTLTPVFGMKVKCATCTSTRQNYPSLVSASLNNCFRHWHWMLAVQINHALQNRPIWTKYWGTLGRQKPRLASFFYIYVYVSKVMYAAFIMHSLWPIQADMIITVTEGKFKTTSFSRFGFKMTFSLNVRSGNEASMAGPHMYSNTRMCVCVFVSRGNVPLCQPK